MRETIRVAGKMRLSASLAGSVLLACTAPNLIEPDDPTSAAPVALEADDEEHVVFGDPGTGPTSFSGDAVDGTHGASADERQDAMPLWGLTGPTPRDILVTRAAAMDADARIEVVVELHHALPPFVAPSASDTERAILVEERIAVAGVATAPVAGRLRSLGATNVHEYWLNPTVAAAVPASAVATIHGWPEVSNLTEDQRPGGPIVSYSGEEVRNGTRTTAFASNGLTGDSGGRAGSRIRLGAIEWYDWMGFNNWPNRLHAGFYQANKTTNRFVYVGDCIGGTCVASSSSAAATHGSYVAKVLAGSVEAGQDPGVTDPLERRRRSGQSSGSDLYYYRVSGYCSTWNAAVQKAVADGVDVLNISTTIGCTGSVGEAPCWADCDCGGLNAALEYAADNGVLVVAGHGNDSDPGVGTCNARYPALRRGGLAAPHLDTNPINTVYDTTPSSTSASRGGMRIRLWDGRDIQDAFAVADLAAPGDFSYFYGTPPFGYDITTTWSGSSLASPAVSGAAGMLREHLSSLGWSTNSRILLVNMLLMGDSYSFDTGGDRRYRMDPRSGAGRTHMHYPSSANLTGPWGWGSHTFNIGNSSTVSFTVWDAGPESPSVTQWKVAMTWKETDYANAADIVLDVFNTCPAGGGAPVLVQRDWSYDLRKRIELVQSEISGRCLEYRVITFSNSMPAGQTRTIYIADYFHGGSPADH